MYDWVECTVMWGGRELTVCSNEVHALALGLGWWWDHSAGDLMCATFHMHRRADSTLRHVVLAGCASNSKVPLVGLSTPNPINIRHRGDGGESGRERIGESA